MNIFGVGLPEMILILAVALLVFGPKRLPEIGRTIAKTLKMLQDASKEFETELKKETEQITAMVDKQLVDKQPVDKQPQPPNAEPLAVEATPPEGSLPNSAVEPETAPSENTATDTSKTDTASTSSQEPPVVSEDETVDTSVISGDANGEVAPNSIATASDEESELLAREKTTEAEAT